MSRERHARVKELFLAAIRQPLEARREFLERASQGDESLRREVDSLLRHHDHDEAEPHDALQHRFRSALDPEELPEAIGNYRVLRKLGEGGMGEVYEAEQVTPVRRHVALKLIKWGMDTKEVVARFESERQALALMNHPGIASVFEAGATEAGRPYFAMEYVAGEPITDYCDRHRATVSGRLDLFLRVCDGVQHAHQKGIIHRDIKPSNILVTLLDDEPVPKIIDFGIAKATSRHLSENSVYTELGQWIGTPEYMSPEQAGQSGLDIDTRTDVYSLGVVLYELLTGAHPFDAAELRQLPIDGIQRMLREKEPPEPSLRVRNLEKTSDSARNRGVELTELERALRGDLDWITMKALEKDRTRRYGSASELAADIGRYLRHEPVLAGPPSRIYRLQKFVRRHRLAVTAALLVVASLLLGIIGTTLALLEADRQRDAARMAQLAAEHEARKAQAINRFLQETLGSASPVDGLGLDASVLDVLDGAANRLGEAFAGQPEVEAAVQQTIGHIYMELAHYDEAERWLTSALRIRETVLGRTHLEVAETLSSLGELELYWKNDHIAAEAHFREALAVRRRLLGEEHLDVADTLDKLALTLSGMAAYEEAIGLTRESLAIGRRVTGGESPQTLVMLATLEHYVGDYDAAEGHFREALGTFRNRNGDGGTDVSGALSSLGSLLHDKGDDRGAERLFRESVAILRERMGGAHIAVAADTANVAMALVSQGRNDEAQRLYQEALSVFPEVLTRGLPHYAQRRIGYGILMTRLARYEEAEQHLQGGLQTFSALMGREDERTRSAASRLVELYEAWGKSDKADEVRGRAR